MTLSSAFPTTMLLLAVAVAMVATACGGEDGTENTVRGLVTDVRSRSIAEVETLTVQEEGTGKLWTFQTQGSVGFTPSHIREHMLQGQQVTVRYQEGQGQLIAVLVSD